MSESMPTRAESHTLRWSDVKFEKFEQQNACVVTFRFLKGHEDQNQQGNVQGSREFFFAPKQERLHLALGALLYAEGKAWTLGNQIHTPTFYSIHARLIRRTSRRSA